VLSPSSASLPLLAPLLAVLLVAAINPPPGRTTSLRLWMLELAGLAAGCLDRSGWRGGASLSAASLRPGPEAGAIQRSEPQARSHATGGNGEAAVRNARIQVARNRRERSRSQPFHGRRPGLPPERAPQEYRCPPSLSPFGVIRRGPAQFAGPVEQRGPPP